MSELFKALQKLEEQNAPEAPQPFLAPKGNKNKKSKDSQPFLRSTLFFIVLLILTIACLGGIWSIKNNSTLFFPGVKKQTIPIAEPNPIIPEKKILPTTTLLPESEQTVVREPFPLLKEPPGERKQAVLFKTKAVSTATVTHMKITPEVQIQNVAFEQFIKKTTSEAEKEQHRARQRKRILYPAERMRKQGDLSKALGLYKKAWSFAPNPDIANNLAAILIQTRQYEEAESYLKQVLSMAPDDEDLRFNLEIAREGKKRKKSIKNQ